MNEETSLIITISFVAIILLIALIAYIYIGKQKKNVKLEDKRRWIEQLPSLVSTLGVLGTFAGITLGLLNFDTAHLEESIPLLLGGLKTAFLTSLTGMIGSLILSRKVSSVYDEREAGMPSTQEDAIRRLCAAIENSSHSNYDMLSNVCDGILTGNTNRNRMEGMIGSKLDALKGKIDVIETATNTIRARLDATNQKLEDVKAATIAESNSAQTMASSLRALQLNSQTLIEGSQSVHQVLEAANSHLATTQSKVEDILASSREKQDMVEAIVGISQESLDETKKYSQVLRDEVTEIEDKMTDTNKLLVQKFDEFSVLLKKSNTEALVEVMKEVTKEFEKQMGTLINKLVQENFDQLNKSVEQLNAWQMENKEMIASLTSQYKQMATNFEATSTTLTKVDEDTRVLVGEGGKLRQIIDALNKVIVEDEKFIKLTQELQETATLNKSNMTQFDAATKTLNDWVRKQRNFVDGVTTLIDKLEELNKIKDYGEEFWEGTRKHMEDGVSIIKSGSESLNSQLTNLDRQFYSRLNTTLAELDACIQAMVKAANRR